MNTPLNYLKSYGNIKLYRKRENIIFQGEIPRFVYVVLDGVIRGYSITSTGDERIVSLFSKGDIFPVAYALGEAPNALLHYTAVSDTRVLEIPYDDFLNSVKNNPELSLSLLNLVSKHYSSLLLRITGLSQSRSIDKICYTLYYLLFRYGIEREPGVYSLDLQLSQSMLADLIGQTREGTAKNLKILKDKGVIDYVSSSYTVYKTKLEGFMGEDSFRDLQLK